MKSTINILYMLYLFKSHVKYQIYITAATSQTDKSFDWMKHCCTDVMRDTTLQEETLQKKQCV